MSKTCKINQLRLKHKTLEQTLVRKRLIINKRSTPGSFTKFCHENALIGDLKINENNCRIHPLLDIK